MGVVAVVHEVEPPPPATRVAVVPEIRRTQLRPVSATITSPLAATATPWGAARRSAVAVTAVDEHVVVAPPPATRVAVVPEMRRTQLRPVSATITSPLGATATPAGPDSESERR